MLVPVLAGTANFLLTFSGQQAWIHRSPAVFMLLGVFGYLLGSVQGTFEAFRSLQQLWHLTNFTVGHSHLTMYAFVTFAIWGGVYALLPRATGKYPSNLAMGVHFWLSTVGVTIYVLALSAAGTIQGLDWIRGVAFIQSVADAAPYWLWRSVGGALMFLGHLVFAWNVWTMTYGRSYAEAPADSAEPAIA
jgi:cytochrome c oxidase cbb3-type subunit 1